MNVLVPSGTLRRMRAWLFAAAVAFAPSLSSTTWAAGGDAALYRIFLTEGTSLVSYGEFVRLQNRVVFSMPLGSASDRPKLQLVSIPDSVVDWPKTERYAASVRYQHFVSTRAEAAFGEMSMQVAQALSQIALTPDARQRLAIAERARQTLVEWPQKNYGYRAAEVGQMVGLLDEVISELRVATGERRFDLSFVATTEPPAMMPLQAAPTLQETIEQALRVAQVTDSAAERISLLQSAIDLLQARPLAVPAVWGTTTRRQAVAALDRELRLDREYNQLSTTLLRSATALAGRADVRGVQKVVIQIEQRDAKLGRQRPQTIVALRAAVEAKLEAARRLRLARDQWRMQEAAYNRYVRATKGPLRELSRAAPLLNDIKALAGPETPQLALLERRVAQALTELAAVTVPPGLQTVHALLNNALQFADSAVRARRRAVLSGDLASAWNASSAAAASLMLLTEARADLQRAIKIPDLR